MSTKRSVMTHSFSRVPKANIPRSSFNRSHGLKTTFDAGYLVPIFVDEALPGDTFRLKMSVFARLATPLHPVMDNMFIDSFFFSVPIRLIWDNWQKFNGEQIDPDDSTDYLIPTMAAPASTGYVVGSLSDYFGIPTEIDGFEHSALWHRAYNLIYNEWFRDQNLQDSVVVNRDDGPDDPSDYVLLRRGKRHDYFTSALPWPQKGPSVPLPLTGNAPTATDLDPAQPGDGMTLWSTHTQEWRFFAGSSQLNPSGSPESGQSAEPGRRLYADLTQVSATTINQLRQAFQIQKIYERDARGGTRYTEIVRSHFGVVSPDARLQRPEYLGGGSQAMNINPVAQTSSTDSTTPQGNLAAIGTAAFSGHGFSKSFTEHCILIGLVNLRADLNYQQGLNRMWSRQTRWDFYWPSLAHIGEQSILNKEIYLQGASPDDDVFGYQERFAEYRYKPSMITGAFRSTHATSLDTWHLAQEFSSLPVLGAEFIEEDPPIDRIIAVEDEPHVLFDSFFDLKCARPMPVYSVPGKIDHF